MPATEPRSKKRLVIAIDGPAGSGKSTVARAVAKVLGLDHLDTGAMYRVVTARALERGIDPTDERALAAVARRLDLALGRDGLTADGHPVGREIRTPKVSQTVSAVSAHPAVRRELVRVQRKMMGERDLVAEGRDIGTVVFPRAPLKIFLTASVDERARRRHKELVRSGHPVSLPTLRREIVRRDALDSNRSISPLRPAADAVVLDTTGKTPKQVVQEIAGLARALERDTPKPRARRRAT